MGARGEKRARRTLEKKGYRHIVSNYRNKTGEIDLIMQDGRTVVFIEVKTRRSEEFVPTEAVVNYKKQKTISKVARHYIRRYKLQHYSGRFDVVVVVMPEKGKTTIRHHIDAFGYR
ncbi:MAG: YraN family protein [Phycisphaerae bacterium]|nr:YraN family protein [Phycisphaerae bacterium]